MELFQTLIDWYMAHINYATIILLMAIESSFIPFPSEIIIPPAGWKAYQGELNIYLVVLSSTIGAIIGALFNYYIAYYLGRKMIYSFAETKFAKLCMIEPKSVQKAEDYFVKHGNLSTFIGRLVPAVRQLISIPAGLSKMSLKNFILYTALGATIWNIILALLGYYLGSQKDLLEQYYSELKYAMLFAGGVFVLYLLYKSFIKKSKTE